MGIVRIDDLGFDKGVEGLGGQRYQVSLSSGRNWVLAVWSEGDARYYWGVIGDLYHGPVKHPGEASFEEAREAGFRHIERLDSQLPDV